MRILQRSTSLVSTLRFRPTMGAYICLAATHLMITRAHAWAAATEIGDVSDQWSDSFTSGSSHKQSFSCDVQLQSQRENSESVDEVAEPRLVREESRLFSSEEESLDLKALRNIKKQARVISSAPSSNAEEEVTHIAITSQQTWLQGVHVDSRRVGKRRVLPVLFPDEEDYDRQRLRKRGK